MEDRDIEIKRRRRRRKRRRDAAIVLGILFIIAALIIYGVFALVRSMVTKSRAKADAKAAAASARWRSSIAVKNLLISALASS